MAITIQNTISQSITPTYSDIIAVVTSNSSSNDNYSFVVDVKNDANAKLARYRFVPNQEGIGVINLSSFFRNELTPPTDAWKGKFTSGVTNGLDRYEIVYGEEWSANPTSSIVLYNGVDDTVGDPEATSSLIAPDLYNYFVPAILNRNEETEYQWDTSPYYYEPAQSITATNVFLTDMPKTDIPIRYTDYMCISMFLGETYSGSGVWNDMIRVRTQAFDVNNSAVGSTNGITNIQSVNSDAIRTSTGQDFQSISGSYFAAYPSDLFHNRLTHMGCGWSNLVSTTPNAAAVGYFWYPQARYGGAYQYGENAANPFHLTFKFQDDNCPYPIYRLMWQNKYGVWDFFNFEGRNQQAVNRIDSQYRQTFIDYDNTDNTAYNISRRGLKNYSTRRNQRVIVSTKYLTQEWADWLEGLFISPNVFLLEGTNAIPINLITATYQKKNDPRSQKIKSYTVEFQYSNPLRTI